MVGLCGFWVLLPKSEKIIFYIYIYKEFSTFGNMSGGTPKANLDFTQKFPPSLKDRTSLYNNNGEMQEAFLGIAD
jgi:hypothetical protein